MQAIDLDAVELMDTGEDSPIGRIRVAFPLSSAAGTAASATVLFEIEPGDTLESHTDSAEELLLILAGEGEAHVGGERAQVRAGQLAVVPALAPHGITNTGTETLRVLGFFAGSTVVSVFGDSVNVIGAPVPIAADLAAAV